MLISRSYSEKSLIIVCLMHFGRLVFGSPTHTFLTSMLMPNCPTILLATAQQIQDPVCSQKLELLVNRLKKLNICCRNRCKIVSASNTHTPHMHMLKYLIKRTLTSRCRLLCTWRVQGFRKQSDWLGKNGSGISTNPKLLKVIGNMLKEPWKMSRVK